MTDNFKFMTEPVPLPISLPQLEEYLCRSVRINSYSTTSAYSAIPEPGSISLPKVQNGSISLPKVH
jgi:hypothetical protein